MRITGQFPFCSAPLSEDTYTGCQGRCVYCFSQNRAGSKGGAAKSGPVAKKSRGIEHPVKALLQSPLGNLAVHLGGLTDPLPDVEVSVHRTAEFIERVLPERAIVMSTKNDIRKFPRVMEAIMQRPGAFLYQTSIETDNAKTFTVIGGEAQASIAERLGAIEEMSSRGVACVVRMQPFVRDWWVGLSSFMQRIASSGARGIIIEHLKFGAGVTRWGRLEKACEKLGMSLDDLGSSRREGDRSLPVLEKIANYSEVSKLAHGVGLACFAGDNVIRGLGDSPYCCGQELMPDFQLEWVSSNNLTAQAWRGRKIDAGAVPNMDKTSGKALANTGLAQDSKRRDQIRRMTIREVLGAWALNDYRMSGMFPYAKKIKPGVWQQSEEWMSFCNKIRKPKKEGDRDGLS